MLQCIVAVKTMKQNQINIRVNDETYAKLERIAKEKDQEVIDVFKDMFYEGLKIKTLDPTVKMIPKPNLMVFGHLMKEKLNDLTLENALSEVMDIMHITTEMYKVNFDEYNAIIDIYFRGNGWVIQTYRIPEKPDEVSYQEA